MTLIASTVLVAAAICTAASAQDLPQTTEPAAPVPPPTAPPSADPEIVRLPEPDAPSQTPKFKLRLGIRGRIDMRFDDARPSGERYTSTHLSFDTVIVTADYDSSTFFGSAEYRFYGANFIYGRRAGYDAYPGEINFPAYAYAGAKITGSDKVSVGVLPVPFDERYWGSSWYNTLGFVYGLEEVYNAGMSYSHTGGPLSFTAGFFPTTGPAGFGRSRDSARYSVNIVKGDPYLPDTSANTERNIAAGRIQYQLGSSSRGSLTMSASAWLSDVRNYDTGRTGSRRAYALSIKDTRAPVNLKLLAARQVVAPENARRNDLIAVGDYDFSYNIAARSTMLFGEASHAFDARWFPFRLNAYASYARVLKEAHGFADTQRINIGVFWNDKATDRIKVWTEGLIARNDPYVGAGQYSSGAAQGGDDRWKVSALVMAGYYF